MKDLNLLLFWTLAAMVALVSFWSLVKLCAVFCCCYCCVFVVVVFSFLVFFSSLYVGSFAVTYVTFSTLSVGFCIPLCRVM